MIKPIRLPLETNKRTSAYTRLFARITEEDGCFTVQVRLFDKAKEGEPAWGEEVTDCIETASMLIATLAAEFSIPAERIEIEIRMDNAKDGIRH